MFGERFLIDLYDVQLAALEGTLELWTERRGLLGAGAVERALCLAGKVAGCLLDALPCLRGRPTAPAAADVDELLGRLERVLALLEGLAGQFDGQGHGVLGALPLRLLAARLERCRR